MVLFEGADARTAFLHVITAWGVAVLVVTETLSLIGAVGPPGLAAAWLLLACGAGVLVYRSHVASLGAWLRAVRNRLKPADYLLLAGAAIVITIIAVIAVAAPPNTVDAMEYHMPRVVQWLHHRSVNFYATHDLRQLKMPPWSEYAMLQFHGLTGGDRFDNLIQWFFFAATGIATSLIAGMLGAGMRGQVLAAVLSLSIPQALLEASGAKNDCVVAFWIAASVYYALAVSKDARWAQGLALGCTVGLACLTKATALVLAPPIIAAIAVVAPKPSRIAAWKLIAVAALTGLAINVPHFSRNWALFRSVLGPAAQVPPNGFKVTNDVYGAGVTVSNVLRNIALHFSTPSATVNHFLEAQVDNMIELAGQDPNDSRTTWDATQFHILPPTRHETTAGNRLHCLLILVAAVLLIRSDNRMAMALAIGTVISFLLFCAIFKWQPWNTRLHLPLFVLWAALGGTLLSKWLSEVLCAAVGGFFLLAAWPYVVAYQVRPLLGGNSVLSVSRSDQYFSDRGSFREPFLRATAFTTAHQCSEIGLDLPNAFYEYPFYALLNGLDGSRGISSANVQNESRRYTEPGAEPFPCIICAECKVPSSRYKTVEVFGNLTAFSDP